MDFVLKNQTSLKYSSPSGSKIMFTPFATVATHKESNLFKKSQWSVSKCVIYTGV